MAKKPNFVFKGSFMFDPTFNPIDTLKYEKMRYLKGIKPQIEKLEKEISTNSKKSSSNQKLFELLINSKYNHRHTTFQYEKGEIYPKNIPFPRIYYIQYAEPHVIITDLSDQNPDWYTMPKLIQGFAEEAYLSYEMGCWLSSIASAVNCCEYLLKYEYLRLLHKLNKDKANQLSLSRNFSLGSFIHVKSTYLTELSIKSQFYDKINYLNDVRVSIYHFSPERAEKVSQKAELEIEKEAPITDEMMLPILAFRVYNIMIELLNHYYNKQMAIQYIKEGAQDWMNKRNLRENELSD
jgi:hypothetical protein